MDPRPSRERQCRRIVATCVVALVLTAVGTRAEAAAGANVSIERVALFKNGLGHFTSSATLPTGATTIKLGQLPVPSHGTFWVGYPKEMKVRALFTSMEDVEEVVPARNVAELLKVNLGRRVTVRTNSPEMPAIVGTIVEVLPEDRPTRPPSPYFMDTRGSASGRSRQSNPTPSLVVIKTSDRTVALNADLITQADFEVYNVKTSVPVKLERPSVRMKLDQPSRGEQIAISYLARGITWSPSYLIDISDPETAELSGKAVVINEVADLKEVQLELVTGFPNIRFGEVNSPVAMSQNLKSFLKALTSRRSESFVLQITPAQYMAPNQRDHRQPGAVPVPGYSTARKGAVSEDLFLYPVDAFSLRRGETACIPLFTAEVPYKHIYTWDIPDMLDKDEHYRARRDTEEQRSAQEVWHSCRLANTMDMPWTTATAEFVKDGQITGQDICYYTAPGTETTIRINRALNVLAEEVELELERERNAATFQGSTYDRVKVKGELKLQNRLDKSANVEVTKRLSGEVLQTVPHATDTPTAKGLKRVNPRHLLVWEIELEPGKEQTLSYTYEVYVRN